MVKSITPIPNANFVLNILVFGFNRDTMSRLTLVNASWAVKHVLNIVANAEIAMKI